MRVKRRQRETVAGVANLPEPVARAREETPPASDAELALSRGSKLRPPPHPLGPLATPAAKMTAKH